MSALKIGWAKRDVTTNGPCYIPGHFNMRISTGVIDPVGTTALVVETSEDCVVFLSIDCVVIRSLLLDEIRAKVKRKNPAIPYMKILASATHTHEAPSHYYDGGKIDAILEEFYTREQIDKMLADYRPSSLIDVPRDGMEIESSDGYRDFLSSQAADAICEAYAGRQPGALAYGYGYAVVAHSRRTVYFDDISQRPGTEQNSLTSMHGHAMMYGETNDANFSHFEAGADHFLNILYTFDEQEKLTGALINIPCPAQNSESESNRRLSADFWHDIKQAISKKHGPVHILGQSGAGGDLSPRIIHYKKAQLRRFQLKYGQTEKNIASRVEEMARRDIAERVAWAFDEILAWAGKDLKKELPLKHIVKTVQLSRRLITDEEYAMAKRELARLSQQPYRFDLGSPRQNLDHNSRLQLSRGRYIKVIQRYEKQKEQPLYPMELHVVRLGEVAFASNQFEMYLDYQHRIQARSPFTQTFVVQLAGQPGMDGGSYLCTQRAQEGKGYSASMFCNQVSYAGGQELVDETVRILEQIHDPA